jgi:hypothetical protein
MAALHHPAIKEKYAFRHFISCESASTRDDLLAVIGSHLVLAFKAAVESDSFASSTQQFALPHCTG